MCEELAGSAAETGKIHRKIPSCQQKAIVPKRIGRFLRLQQGIVLQNRGGEKNGAFSGETRRLRFAGSVTL